MKTLTKITSALTLLFITADVFAQGPPPPPSNTPIDSALLLLIGAAVGIGAKKLNKSAKRNKKV